MSAADGTLGFVHAARPRPQPPLEDGPPSAGQSSGKWTRSASSRSPVPRHSHRDQPAPGQLLERGSHGSQLTRSRARPPAHLVGEVRSQVAGAKGEAEQGPPHVHLSPLPASRGHVAEPSLPPLSPPPGHEAPLRQSAGLSPGARLLKGATPARAASISAGGTTSGWKDPGPLWLPLVGNGVRESKNVTEDVIASLYGLKKNSHNYY